MPVSINFSLTLSTFTLYKFYVKHLVSSNSLIMKITKTKSGRFFLIANLFELNRPCSKQRKIGILLQSVTQSTVEQRRSTELCRLTSRWSFTLIFLEPIKDLCLIGTVSNPILNCKIKFETLFITCLLSINYCYQKIN